MVGCLSQSVACLPPKSVRPRLICCTRSRRWSTHYRWVIMLIVLVVGFTILGVVGTWLKRRHDAKRPGLYHGPTGSGSSGALRSGALSPAPVGYAVSPAPAQSQSRTLATDSVASSSRTEVVPPKAAPAPGSRRLNKPPQTVADVEIRQISH